MDTTTDMKSWASWMDDSFSHQPRDPDAFEAYLKNEHKKIGDLIDEDTYLEKLEEFNHYYVGFFDSFVEFVEEDIRENHDQEIPEWLDSHIDWDSFARDYKCSGDFWSADVGGWVHVFRTF